MKTVVRKLDMNATGPSERAVLTEQELIAHGYVWDYTVFNDHGVAVRTGVSKIKTEAELRAFLASGMSRVQWEAMPR